MVTRLQKKHKLLKLYIYTIINSLYLNILLLCYLVVYSIDLQVFTK